MFESLSDRITKIIKNAKGESKLTEDNIQDAIREVRKALLEADVSLRVVKSFISSLKDRALGEEVLKSLSPTQQLVKIVYDELVKLMGEKNTPINTSGKPNLIMLLGLQGSGKTTASAKLGLRLRKNGRNPLLVAADVYRPAAIDQLKTLGKQVNISVFSIADCTDVQQIVSEAIAYAKDNGHNSLIIDTAGRLQIDTDMMAELLIIDRFFEPAEKLLVLDAMTGQESINVSETFNTQLDISGVILSKLDGDARGGSALSIAHATGKPIKFVSMGEKIEALEPFHPERMAQRILGMGDMLSLIEKAQDAINLDEAKELEQRMMKKEFSLEDFIKIQKQVKMLGSLDQILGMLPIQGLSKSDKEELAHAGEQQFKKIEASINSMTPEERKKPETINTSRKERIAKGSGQTFEEISRFLKEFEKMQKMMKNVAGMTKKMKKSSKKMKLPPGFKGGNFPGF